MLRVRLAARIFGPLEMVLPQECRILWRIDEGGHDGRLAINAHSKALVEIAASSSETDETRVFLALGAMAMTLFVLFLFSRLAAAADPAASRLQIPAMFVLGDSTMDTGNLDYRPNTVHLIHDDELPYGRDFVPPGPTGRASNGKLAPDLLAEYLDLPSPVDSLQPQAQGQRLLKGINFAAGGSGILNGTGITTISLSQQLDAFVKSIGQMDQLVGPQGASQLLAKSLFLISTGNNDIFNYVFNPATRFRYQPTTFNALLLSQFASDLERVYRLGARRIVVLSVGPLGCTPVVLTVFSNDGSCVEAVNSQVRSYNAGLQSLLLDLRSRLPGINLLYADAYDILYKAIQSPSQYGFKYGKIACCGSGMYRGSPLNTCSRQTDVCPVSDEHVFWDLVHPTQAMYKLINRELFHQLVKYL